MEAPVSGDSPSICLKSRESGRTRCPQSALHLPSIYPGVPQAAYKSRESGRKNKEETCETAQHMPPPSASSRARGPHARCRLAHLSLSGGSKRLDPAALNLPRASLNLPSICPQSALNLPRLTGKGCNPFVVLGSCESKGHARLKRH